MDVVNAALRLRRPLLVTGAPGTGKSSLAHAVAAELGLGPVLVWPINTRATLTDALYRYDAIGPGCASNRTAPPTSAASYAWGPWAPRWPPGMRSSLGCC